MRSLHAAARMVHPKLGGFEQHTFAVLPFGRPRVGGQPSGASLPPRALLWLLRQALVLLGLWLLSLQPLPSQDTLPVCLCLSL